MVKILSLMASVLCLMVAVENLCAAEPTTGVPRILYITQSGGFVHSSVRRPKDDPKKLSPSEIAMMQLAKDTGKFTVDCSQDVAADFTQDNLKHYDIVMFYTTGTPPISPENRDYFINTWLKQKGHGFIGVHSATDTFYDRKDPVKNEEFKWYWDMIGGSFNGHPWTSGMTVTLTIHDTKFPAMQPFGSEYQIKDEIYQYMNWQPEKVHVLMSLNMEKCTPKMPYHVPVAWCKTFGQGRVYVNNLGHNETTWTNKDFLQSMTSAIAWTHGEIAGDSTPNPEVSAEEDRKAKEAVAKEPAPVKKK